ncbi:MAG: hypothetical protein AAF700_10170 [Pseudomonadota bacterium]
MIFWGFILGMILCGVTLSLIAHEDSYDKFGSAVAMFSGWCAFGMLLMGGTWGLGIVLPGLMAAAVLVLRTTTFGKRLSALAPYKMPMGIGALVCSVLVWLGVLNMMEGLPNG